MNYNKTLGGCILLLALTLSACTKDSTSKERLVEKVAKEVYFDFESYFNTEINRLANSEKNLKKVVKYKGEEEVKIIEADSNTLVNELKLFSSINLNRPDWIDKYARDTVVLDTILAPLIRYRALEEDLNIRIVSIYFLHNEPFSFSIEKKSESVIAKIDQTLIYERNCCAKIISSQSTLSEDAKVFEIDLYWEK